MGNFSRKAAFLFLGIVWISALPARAQQKIFFGIQVKGRAYKTVETIRPLLNDLQQDLSRMMGEEVVIETKVFRDAESLSHRLSEGKIDVARVNPEAVIGTYLRSKNVDVLAIETKTVSKDNPFVIVSSLASGVTDLSQMDGKSFLFGEEGSLDGEKLPKWVLLRNLVLPDHLKSVSYTGPEAQRMASLLEGKADASLFTKDFFENSPEKEKMRVLMQYSGVLEAWMVRSDFHPKLRRALEGDLFQMRRTPGLEKIGRSGFVRGALEDFEEAAQASIVEEALLSEGLGKLRKGNESGNEPKVELPGVNHEK